MKERRFAQLADQIGELVGGKENVTYLANCMTRLRFVVNDKSKIKEEEIKKIKGVKGIAWAGDQFQIIIGQAVDQALVEVKEAMGIGDTISQEPASDKKKKFNPMALFETIAAIMSPVITLLIGAGVIRVLMIVLSYLNLLSSDSSTYAALDFIADSAYYFLPIIVGAAAAVRFKMNMYVGMFMGAILLHPNFISMVGEGTTGTIFGLPIYAGTYSSTLFPVILNVYVASKVEKVIKKYSPDLLRTLLVPFGTILITAPLALSILSPLGAYIGNYLSAAVIWIYETVGFVGVGIVAALYPMLVSIGMHNAFAPYLMQQISLGQEALLSPAVVINNINIGWACAGIGLKDKNREVKTEATSCAVTAIVGGITEPGLYGFVLGNKRVLASVMIGNFFGGALAGLFKVYATAFAGSYGVLGLTVFLTDNISNLMWMALAVILGSVISLICTMVLYRPKAVETEEAAEKETQPVVIPSNMNLLSPISGEVKPLSECADAAFAQKALGDGVLINPEEGKVYAPFNGKVVMLFNTKHAVGLQSESGTEALIHVGLDTVNLNGEGFKAHVKDGDTIRKGDLLLEFDLEGFRKKGIDTSTPVIITNTDQYSEISPIYGKVVHGQEVVQIAA